MARLYSFAPGEYYHIYNRGTEKRAIFLDKFDYERFIRILFHCNGTAPVNVARLRKGLSFADYQESRGERLVYIGAYCLMPNHFHLLLREREEGNIPKFMKKLLTAYSMYFNVKNNRKGRLFETSFLASHAYRDEYLKYLFAYIHLNPVKLIEPKWKEVGVSKIENVQGYLYKYLHSSFPDYAGSYRDEGALLDKEEFPEYFPSANSFTDSIFEWIKLEKLI